MTEAMTPEAQQELEWRRRRWEQISALHDADEERQAELAVGWAEQAQRAKELAELREQLAATGDLEGFRTRMDEWSRRPSTGGFHGMGQMFVHQLANAADDPSAVADLFTDVLTAPADEAEAAKKLGRLLEYVESVKQGAHPAPKRVPFLCSYMWASHEPSWPCMWPNSEKMLVSLGWLTIGADHIENYLAFRKLVLSLDDDPAAVGDKLWWVDHDFPGLDPTLVERCEVAVQWNIRTGDIETYESEELRSAAETNAKVRLGDLRMLGDRLTDEIARALGRSVKVTMPKVTWSDAGQVRADAWVGWRLTDETPAVRVWANRSGVGVVLHPGWYRNGWYQEAFEAIRDIVPDGFQLMAVEKYGDRLTPTSEPTGEFVVGRWFDGGSALGRPEFVDDVIAVTASLQPVVDRLVHRGAGAGAAEPAPSPEDDPLAHLIEEFKHAKPYPTEADEAHQADRRRMADLLAPDEIEIMGIDELRGIYNSNRYGNPGPQSVLNTTVRDATAEELEDLFRKLKGLLWGDEPVENRIDELLSEQEKVKGLGEAVILKLLAIAHPDRFIPVYPYRGDYGKARLMQRLGLDPLSDELSAGQKHVQSNDAIRRRLDPFFPGDPWGQAQFFYWLLSRPEGGAAAPEEDVLATLAEELFVDRSFLADIVELLRDKGQVIFYGPPGTGKTYLAEKLAEALAPDLNRRMTVQFHPSMTYEDFFEGYRPEGAAGGQLTYRLTAGPLARLADRAEQRPGIDHVLVIDEINRANLPKVLGELLYLLEYRGRSVHTTYRPDAPFQLPKNVLVIGTMNTADRSIALIDAALRRRFHFIPFFPHEGAIKGLLTRWLEHFEQPVWIGELLEMVNDNLIRDLGGPHLQIGPSHFMKKGLDENAVRRIWQYNILPFIEDQFFGQPDRIRNYEFDRVLAEYRRQTPTGTDPATEAVGVEGAPGAEETVDEVVASADDE